MGFLRTYLRVLSLLRPEARAAFALGFANLLVAGFQFLDPLLFGRVIELLSRSDHLSQADLWQQATTLLGTWTAVGAAGIASAISVALFADRLAHRRRMAMIGAFHTHVLTLPPAFHGARHSGEVMRILFAGIDALFSLWLGFYREQLSSFISAIILLPLSLILNWRLGLSLAALVVAFVTMTGLVFRATERRQREVERHHNALAAAIHDGVANVAVVQSFRALPGERARFSTVAGQVLATQFPVLGWWAFATVVGRTANTAAVLAITITGTVLHVRGQASVGEIVAFMGLATLLISRLDALMWFVSKLFTTRPALDEFFGILDTGSAVAEAPDAVPLPAGPGAVRFDHVGFAYPDGPPILADISLDAAPGTVVALVGRTGAGKSTAMALLQRMWNPTAGTITIDGHDITRLRTDDLRRAIGVVFQDSMLFNRSIRDNLLVGRADATQEQIEHACRLAEAHDFILRQPQGYDTMVGERGATLSGGQKQRLAIARALLKDPPILVLDEATSALDAATEAKVTSALRTLMAGRTTFIIAHRLSTVRDADQILVFEDGRIVERGRFAELVACGGVFAELVAGQLAAAPALAEAAD